MRKTATLLAMILLTITFIPMLSNGSDQPSRAELLPLFVEYGTYRFDEKTGSVMFDTVTIGPEGRLEIVGVSFIATSIITLEEQPNSSISIHGTQESWGYVMIKEGELNVQVGNISLGRAEISVQWADNYPLPGEAGDRSLLNMEALGGGINVTGTKIEVIGENGAVGDDSYYGASGGDAQVMMQDINGGEVKINGGWIRSVGGTGGGAPSGMVNSGTGGQSDITLDGSTLNISHSYIMSYGGKAGTVSQGAEGNTGGSSMMRLRSNDDLLLYDTDLTALPGNNTGIPKYPTPSNIVIVSRDGSIFWDRGKPEDDKRMTMSYLDSLSLQVSAENGAFFHEVHVGETFPTSLDDTEISLFWWIDILVTDDLGSPIKNAIVYYNINDGIETYPSASDPLLAEEYGWVTLELRANDGQDWRRYRFFAQYGTSSASGATDVIRFDLNANRVENVKIKLADFEIHTDMEDPVLDTWNITGTAFSKTGTPISSLGMYIDNQHKLSAIDHSKDPSSPYSNWSIPINTSEMVPGIYIFELVIRIGNFRTRINWTIELSRSFFNHPPIIDQVMIIANNGLFEGRENEIQSVHVTTEDSGFRIDTTLMEKDHGSKVLIDGEGVWISYLNLDVIMYGHPLKVYSKKLEFTTFDAGESGRYGSTFLIDTARQQGGYDPWVSGKYLIIVTAVDDGGLAAKEIQILIDLHIDQPALLQLRLGKETLETPTPHPTRSEDSFYLENPEDRELTRYFDLTGCKDLDDPGYFPHPTLDRSWMNLTTTVYIQPEGDDPVLVIRPFLGIPGFSHTFDLKNYSMDDVVLFEINLHVVDKDGVTSDLTVLVEVTVTEPLDKENRVPFWIIALSVMMWIAAMLVAFIIILPIYTRRRKDKVRRLMKDPTLKAVTIEAMKGEKPSNFLISREDVVEGLIDKMETGKIPKTEYEKIANDIKTAQEKVSINSDKVK